MNQPITRRDFIGGAAVAISGSLSWRWAMAESVQGGPPLASGYPPIRTGMRGSHPGSFEVAHAMRDGKRWDEPENTGEEYDLVVVGGGLSGLAAAWFYREANPEARILILDNHDDFGGHAKRNEFWHGDTMVLAQGGTEFIEDLRAYSDAGRRLLSSIGIDVSRYSEFSQPSVYDSRDMRGAVFLGRETFGEDLLVTGAGQLSWDVYFAQMPLSVTTQEELVRLYSADVDYLPHLSTEEKVAYLKTTSYQAYLADVVGLGAEAIAFLWRSTTWAIGLDAISTWVAVLQGWPGTDAMGVGDLLYPDYDGSEEPQFMLFPDGNATIARMLVRNMVPGVAPGNTLEDLPAARFDYGAIDQADSPVRVRLNSTAVDVRHRGNPVSAESINVTYVQGGQAHTVSGRHCVLACYNAAIPYLCQELPGVQKTALRQSLKAPLVYTSVLLRNWKAFARLGLRRARCPGSYFESVSLTTPVNYGGYRHSARPEDPVVVRLVRAPLDPALRGQAAPDQWLAGRRELLTTSFETFEVKIRDQLGRMLSAGGFDPARDIEAITVNRWPHGYAYGQDPESGQMAWLLDEFPPERSPWIAARQTFGRIAIANSDAVATAMTEGAFEAADLAVKSLVS